MQTALTVFIAFEFFSVGIIFGIFTVFSIEIRRLKPFCFEQVWIIVCFGLTNLTFSQG